MTSLTSMRAACGATTLVRSSPTRRAAVVLKISERMLGEAEHSGGHHEAASSACGMSPSVPPFLRVKFSSREAWRVERRPSSGTWREHGAARIALSLWQRLAPRSRNRAKLSETGVETLRICVDF